MTAKHTKPTQERRTGADSTNDSAGNSTERKMEDKAQAIQADVKRKAEAVKEGVKDGVDRVVSDDVQQKVGATAQDIRQDFQKMSEDVQSQAAELAETRKSEAAQRLGGVASAIREAGHSFEERDEATLAHYTNSLAEQIDSFSHNLREREIGALIDDARQMAHRQPEMFVTGALALGFLVGRFFKSSASSSRYEDRYDNRYGDGGQGYGNQAYARDYQNTAYRNSGYQNSGYRNGGRYGAEGRYADNNMPYRSVPDAPAGNQAYGPTYNDPQRSFGSQYASLGQQQHNQSQSASGDSERGNSTSGSSTGGSSTGGSSTSGSSAQTNQARNANANGQSQKNAQHEQGKGGASAKNPTGQTGGSRSQE